MRRLLAAILIVFVSFSVVWAQGAAEEDECGADALARISGYLAAVNQDTLAKLKLIRNAAVDALAACVPVDAEAIPILTDETHIEREMGCALVFDISRGTQDLQFIISGEAKDEALVDIVVPGEETPEDVLRQLDKTFLDTGDLYVQQIYARNNWPLGIYLIRLERDDVVKTFSFEMDVRGDYSIYVYCE